MAEPTTNPSSRDQPNQQKSDRKSNAEQQSSAQGAMRTDRERGMETAREGASRGQRGTGIQRRGGTPELYSGPIATPFAMMRRMMDDMDRLFENFGAGWGPALSTGSLFENVDNWSRLPTTRQAGTLWSPPLEIFERDNDFVVRADLPGLSKDDVNVDVDNGVLTISGERRSENEENREGYFRSERSYGSFWRTVPLPEGVNEDQVKASFKDGVLEVTMPKPPAETSKRRRIEVK
ncbi:MAG TPA: Hsp20/alpha crystallin family protein [Gemmatimonadaceae bacterium]|nr:Hsp20/alpha crystallin family protein [Gemmatimonadaceae bacterium]